jgi:hypothetical protein
MLSKTRGMRVVVGFSRENRVSYRCHGASQQGSLRELADPRTPVEHREPHEGL